MGAAKEMWMAEIEQAQDEFWSGEISEDEFRSQMKSKGFDPDEIDDMIHAIQEEQGK